MKAQSTSKCRFFSQPQTHAGLAFIDSETKLIVADAKLPSVRLISGINKLWRSPNKSLDICRLDIHGEPNVFHPFAVKTKMTIEDVFY